MWSSHARGNQPAVGRAFVEQLDYPNSQFRALFRLAQKEFWIAEAEMPVLKLLRAAASSQVKFAAAWCLLQTTRTLHYAEIVDYACAMTEEDWQGREQKMIQIIFILDTVRARTQAISPNADLRLAQCAFGLLPLLEKDTPGGGYGLALALGPCLNENFQADQKNPKYSGRYGLMPEFFADTTQNAIQWWNLNSKSFKGWPSQVRKEPAIEGAVGVKEKE